MIKKLKVRKLDLSKHWTGIDILLREEEWPFIIDDFKISHNQEKSMGLVILDDEDVVGFFTLHNFDSIAYHDLFIVKKKYRNNIFTFMELMKIVKNHLRENFLTIEVAHCTKDSSAFVKFLGFKSRAKYVLVRREIENKNTKIKENHNIIELGYENLYDIINLDEKHFGIKREKWISTLLSIESCRFFGILTGKQVVAFLVLRKRYGNSYSFDTICGESDLLKIELVDYIVNTIGINNTLDTFVLKDSYLEEYLIKSGFNQPYFFQEIGPLEEYTKGDINLLNINSMVTMSWL